jgi:trans-aconitate methyltransferase
MTAWSGMGASFLRDTKDAYTGDWAVGQGIDASDRLHLRAILTELEPCSLLDVGCGTGIELDGILTEGLKVDYTGLDLTPEFVTFCRERFPQATFMQGNILSLSAARVYDVVSARAVLEHLEDGERALRRLWEACKQVTVVSWFIPPSNKPYLHTTMDGFTHQRYDRILMNNLVKELGPSRFEATNFWNGEAQQNWLVWELWR